MCLPFVDSTIEYDAYLVATNVRGRRGVLFDLYSCGTLDHLTVRVIDIIDETLVFHERAKLLMSMVARPYRVGYYPLVDTTHLHNILHTKQKHNKRSEGMIVRRLDGGYNRGGRDRQELSLLKFRELTVSSVL
jgi:hypothetical protein